MELMLGDGIQSRQCRDRTNIGQINIGQIKRGWQTVSPKTLRGPLLDRVAQNAQRVFLGQIKKGLRTNETIAAMRSVLFTGKYRTNSQPKEGRDPNDRSKLNANFCATPKELSRNFVVTGLDIVLRSPNHITSIMPICNCFLQRDIAKSRLFPKGMMSP